MPAFGPRGITAEQFSLLVGIGGSREPTLAELAARAGVDATTLSRSVTSLERRGLVRNHGAGPGRQTPGADRCGRPADERGHGRLGARPDPIGSGSWRGGIACCRKRLVPACRRRAGCGLGCLIKGLFRSLARDTRRPMATHGPPLVW
ncbi:MarR family winged helix-turn-helix transcriptional regulator [Microvirga yunnanensis]|uniref:MarR family winged helix-turn-helix transcriptional regulator n=1 Tax=Microvirga yunnanensis TaxID=2953740 RepID=UPI0021C822FE|nr:MarR family transcriptional regulator [Microvirga sp. HBU65207]